MILSNVNLLRWSLPLVFLLLVTVQSVVALGLGDSCVNSRGEPGKCAYISNCKPMKKFINQFLTTADYTFVVQSLCERVPPGYPIMLVCCADPSASLPEPPNCGVQSDRVSYDQTTKIDEFPWTALLMAQMADGNHGFPCAGTLINKRYVLTAAHCVLELPPGWRVHSVRLGEWQLDSRFDCEDGLCNRDPIDIPIERILYNKNYAFQDRNRHNDIALVRLGLEVDYSTTIRPICLPLSDSSHPLKNASMYFAGWGLASNKMKIELQVAALKNCARIYQRNGIFLQTSQICARAVQLNDSCTITSGGPLMQQQGGSWYMYGLASILNFGNNGVPDVYTNVTQYIDWIRRNVEMFS